MESIERQVLNLIKEHFDLQNPNLIEPSATIEDLDADSLDIIEVTMSAERVFEISIEDDQIENIETVQDLITIVEDKIGK